MKNFLFFLALLLNMNTVQANPTVAADLTPIDLRVADS